MHRYFSVPAVLGDLFCVLPWRRKVIRYADRSSTANFSMNRDLPGANLTTKLACSTDGISALHLRGNFASGLYTHFLSLILE